METVNASGWTATKERLEATAADIVCVQEHRTPEGLVSERSAQVLKMGWKSLWAPAVTTADEPGTDARFTSGGVAVFVRKYMGLTLADGDHDPVIIPGRLVAGCINAPGTGPITVYSAYLTCSVGWSGPNIDLMDALAAHASHQNLWILGADFNMPPEELASTQIHKAFDAEIRAPKNADTCISPYSSRTIDFFLVQRSLAQAVSEAFTDRDADTRPHRPVATEMAAGLQAATKTVFRPSDRLPTEPIIGPVPEPPSFSRARRLAVGALEAFRHHDPKAFDLYDDAFKEWASTAERAVAASSDHQLTKRSSRSSRPSKITVPLVPRAPKEPSEQKSPGFSNFLQRTQEIAAFAAKAWRGNASWSEVRRMSVEMWDKWHGWQPTHRPKDDPNIADDLREKADALVEHHEPTWQCYADFLATVTALKEQFTTGDASAASRRKAVAVERWKLWREKEIASSSRGLFSFVKEPKAWTPPDIVDDTGRRVADSPSILHVEAVKYKSLWKAKAEGQPRVAEGNVPCERLEPSKLRQTARSFKKRTGVAPDGWHPRHMALIPDEGLEVLAILYEIMEVCGHLPMQQSLVCVFLLDKPSGGTRPIGLFTAFYRVWSKARQGLAAQWASRNDRPFFAAGKNRSTIDPVWRQSVRNQIAKQHGMEVASLCWDLRKFYENVSHSKLKEQALKWGFPPALVSVAINAYKMARVVTYDGCASEEVFPTQGIVAGDSLSDVLVKIYYIEALDKVAKANAEVDLEVYFDDIQVAARGPQEVVKDRMIRATGDLKRAIVEDMEAHIVLDKASVTASSQPLCKSLRDALGESAGPVTNLAQFLGVDNTLGRCRVSLRYGSKWKARARAGKLSRPRLARLRAGCAKGVSRIFAAGVQAAATYGVEVVGIADSELKQLQTTALSSMTPSTRGRSRAAVFVAKGDPTWRPAVAPILRWAQEVWQAASAKKSAVPSLSVKELRRAWATATRTPPGSWNSSRGAVDAAFLAAKRLGWELEDPFHLKTDLGSTIPLFDTSPKVMAILLREAVQRKWQRQLAASVRKAHPDWEGERVCPDPVQRVIASSWGKAHPVEAHYAVKSFCNAIWTKQRAKEAGYQQDSLLCDFCGMDEDTIEHRVCHCPAAQDVRAEFADEVDIMMANALRDPLFAFRGIFSHPGDKAKRPPPEGGGQVEWGRVVDHESAQVNLGGAWCFFDGSCSRHPVAELRRASWAAAFYDHEGYMQATFSGPVWSRLPQTPQAGEYLSAAAGIQLVRRPTRFVGDCRGVVEATQALKTDLRPRGAYAGLLKDTLQHGRLDLVSDCSWMPSHTGLAHDATFEQGLRHRGNQKADEAAGSARELAEEAAGQDVLQEGADKCLLAVRLLKAVGSILSLWPALPRAVERIRKTPTDTLHITHSWKFDMACKLWRCSACGLFSQQPKAEGPPQGGHRCHPGRFSEKAERAADLGHVISAITVSKAPFFFCTLCGCHGSWRWIGLLRPCIRTPGCSSTKRWLEQALSGQVAEVRGSRKPKRPEQPLGPGLARRKRAVDPLWSRKAATKLDRDRWQSLAGNFSATAPQAPQGATGAFSSAAPPRPADPAVQAGPSQLRRRLRGKQRPPNPDPSPNRGLGFDDPDADPFHDMEENDPEVQDSPIAASEPRGPCAADRIEAIRTRIRMRAAANSGGL